MLRTIASKAAPPFLAVLSGLLTAFSFPGWNRGQWAWVSLVPLLFALVSTSRLRNIFGLGFLAGFAAYAGSLTWVFQTCRLGGVSPAVSVLAWFSLSSLLALYWGCFALFVRRLDCWPAPLRPFAGAAFWVALEFLRSHLFTGFPWLLLAYSQWNVPAHLPLAELAGTHAVSFMLVLFNFTIFGVGSSIRRRPGYGVSSWAPSAGTLVLLVAASVMLDRGARDLLPPPDMPVALVQGNIDQYKKWDESHEREIMDTYSRLTREAAAQAPALVVWPETAVPGWVPNDGRLTGWVSSLAREVKTPILAGAVTRDGGDYNAAFLFNAAGEISGRYRKRHLVPFGERVPFQSILGRWIPVLGQLGDFDASQDRTVFSTGGARFGVNICFESLFPGLTGDPVRDGAGFLANLTNDGWFLDTAAVEQHFAAAPFRAVENRAWVLCATNTGVTAAVDPRGRVAARLPRGAPGVLHARISSRGVPPLLRRKDLFAWACAFAGLFFLTYRRPGDRIAW